MGDLTYTGRALIDGNGGGERKVNVTIFGVLRRKVSVTQLRPGGVRAFIKQEAHTQALSLDSGNRSHFCGLSLVLFSQPHKFGLGKIKNSLTSVFI